jgi:CheY-like chemotaxis protein
MAIKNIYIADDDTDDIEFFQEALAQVDASAALASGKNGVELMKKLLYPELPVPDIVFLDINMPLMNGLECLKEIKQHLHLKDIPIVMYTTSALGSTIELAYMLGANLLVEKPAEFDALKSMLSSILEIDFARQQRPDISRFVYKAS